jgi:hypothetical protein
MGGSFPSTEAHSNILPPFINIFQLISLTVFACFRKLLKIKLNMLLCIVKYNVTQGCPWVGTGILEK